MVATEEGKQEVIRSGLVNKERWRYKDERFSMVAMEPDESKVARLRLHAEKV